MHANGHRAVAVIQPRTSGLRLGEVVRSRDLLYFLAWRDIKVRYAQAAIGAAWAVLQPVLMMVIFALFFGRLAKVPSDGLPYAVFAFTGLVPWTFFSNAVGSATESLVTNVNLITKVYFPRVTLPFSAILSWLPDLGLASAVLLLLLPIYGLRPSWTVVFLPLMAVLAVLAAAAASLGLSALNVKYRDVRYAVPFLLQVWFFVTPVVYPASLVPRHLRVVLALNPMTGVVEGFRWSVLGHVPAPWTLLAVSTATTLVLLALSTLYFRRAEQDFADVI
ncbi:MAG TPA: ABC transporter permease [Acidimicrobiales bacterium]|nr:ABC transporter permease [Acidimicrobiales bacterium]